MHSDHVTLARRCYAAYTNHDRAALEQLIAADFHFTSPYDDAIDRKMYFARCWPNNERTRSIDIERIVPDGEAAIVTYTLVTRDGKHIHNTERLAFAGDQIASAEVFFGAEHDAHGAFVAAKP